MFHYKIQVFLICTTLIKLAFTFQDINSTQTYSSSYKCLIQNEEYRFEFLYHSDDMFYSNRLTGTPFTYSLDNLLNLNRIRWILETTGDETILIKSYQSNKYLCASGRYVDRFKIRRRVFLSNNFEKETCEWKLESSDKKGMMVYMINVKYNQALYAASFFFKKDEYKRNVFLWHDKNEKYKSKKFEWIIECL